MMEEGVPRKEIAEKTGFNLQELSHFAVAWGMPQGVMGRPRRDDDHPRCKKCKQRIRLRKAS